MSPELIIRTFGICELRFVVLVYRIAFFDAYRMHMQYAVLASLACTYLHAVQYSYSQCSPVI